MFLLQERDVHQGSVYPMSPAPHAQIEAAPERRIWPCRRGIRSLTNRVWSADAERLSSRARLRRLLRRSAL